MSATRAEVYEAIDTERAYQLKLWSRGEADDPLTIGEYVLLLEEYAAKARYMWSGEIAPETETLEVVRKIAALGVACMEEHGAPRRQES